MTTNKHIFLFVVTVFMFPAWSSVHATLIATDQPTFDPTVAVSNFNQFKNNIDSKFDLTYFKGYK
jgi:hypothetical protein